MYTCTHCKSKFKNKPFIAYPSRKKYCSWQCLPESAMERPYSFQYFTLIESIRDIESSINNIKTLQDRQELECAIDQLSDSYTADVYGDDERQFYKRLIIDILPCLDELYDKIHNIFKERKLELKPALFIYWYELSQIVGDEITNLVFDEFEEGLKNFDFKNVYWFEPTTNIDINNTVDKLCLNTKKEVEILSKLFLKILNRHRKLLTVKQLGELECCSYCIYENQVCQCVACGAWECIDDFTFDEELNVYKCNQWSSCLEYDYPCNG